VPAIEVEKTEGKGRKKIRGLGNRYRGSDATVKNLWIGREEKKNAKKQQQL
jgi:hypothetical protein